VSVADSKPLTDTYRYTGHRLSDLLALQRDEVTIVCAPCGFSATVPIRELIAAHGNVVLPHLLSLVTPSCPRRGKADSISCGAVYETPLMMEEELQLKAGRS
jgi:hypothetical protein